VIPYILALIVILLAILGTPLFAVILAVAMLGFNYLGVDLSVIAIEIYRIADTPILLALPLFTFAGYILSESHTSQRLVRFTRAFLGWMPCVDWQLLPSLSLHSLQPLQEHPALLLLLLVHYYIRRYGKPDIKKNSVSVW